MGRGVLTSIVGGVGGYGAEGEGETGGVRCCEVWGWEGNGMRLCCIEWQSDGNGVWSVVRGQGEVGCGGDGGDGWVGGVWRGTWKGEEIEDEEREGEGLALTG